MRSKADVARTRAYWVAGKPGETTAPAYALDPPVWWHVALALGGALFVQSSFAPWLALRGAAPPLVTLVIGWYAVRGGAWRGLAFGLTAGAAEDAFSGVSIAAWTFASAVAGACAGRVAPAWLADTNVALALGAAALSLVRDAAFSLAMQVQGRPIALPVAALHAALWQSAEAGLLTLLVLRVFPDLVRTDAYGR